jgi:hypothetical protein
MEINQVVIAPDLGIYRTALWSAEFSSLWQLSAASLLPLIHLDCRLAPVHQACLIANLVYNPPP